MHPTPTRKIDADSTLLGFQIAPMIDVTFVILMFFMVMAGSVKVEHELATKLPNPGDPAKAVQFPLEEITLLIAEDGTVTLNDEALDAPTDKALPRLGRTLLRLATSSDRQKQPLLVTLQAEEQASYERIVDVLNSLHQAGIQNVTFTVGGGSL